MSAAKLSPQADQFSHLSDQKEHLQSCFSCNICLEELQADNSVLTQCGHLYCWPCIYRWISAGHGGCPVCKAGVSQDNLIPIFVAGESGRSHHKSAVYTCNDHISKAGTLPEPGESSIPSRPLGHRPPIPEGLQESSAERVHVGYNDTILSFSGIIWCFPTTILQQFQRCVWDSADSDLDGREADKPEDDKNSSVLMLIILFSISILGTITYL